MSQAGQPGAEGGGGRSRKRGKRRTVKRTRHLRMRLSGTPIRRAALRAASWRRRASVRDRAGQLHNSTAASRGLA
eukprot:scaffold36285_cov119-Isochrysis_galbana.AAC.2